MQTVNDHPLQQDLSRAENYDALALLLSAAPSAQVLQAMARVSGDDTALGRAWAALAQVAGSSDPAAVEREYFNLFIGVGRGELLPYASFYLTGFLNERPLAALRGDLTRLGIARQPDDHEPEDRIALICAVMAAYARGEFSTLPDAPTEIEFFSRHLGSWAGLFFQDLAGAPAGRFYTALAGVGTTFITIEQQAFALDAQGHAVA